MSTSGSRVWKTRRSSIDRLAQSSPSVGSSQHGNHVAPCRSVPAIPAGGPIGLQILLGPQGRRLGRLRVGARRGAWARRRQRRGQVDLHEDPLRRGRCGFGQHPSRGDPGHPRKSSRRAEAGHRGHPPGTCGGAGDERPVERVPRQSDLQGGCAEAGGDGKARSGDVGPARTLHLRRYAGRQAAVGRSSEGRDPEGGASPAARS
jgi:hypothetical protein